MLDSFYENIPGASLATPIILSVALILLSGFAMTRITKRLRLPNVTAYIVAGILIGPYCLDLIPGYIIEGMDFISDVALAFIAFTTGEYFRVPTLKKNGGRVVVITLMEALSASVMVFAVGYWVLKLELTFAIVLAALASATAPASMVMTIRQTGAKGDFVDTLLQVVALDDVLCLLMFSVSLSIALAAQSGSFQLTQVVRPFLMNLVGMGIGGLFGLILKSLLQKRSTDNRLIVSIAMLFTFCGICALLDVSPLLGCMSMGTVYINAAGDDKLFKQLNYFSPPIMLLFFVRSGLNFRLDALMVNSAAAGGVSLLTVGIMYFFVRTLSKYAGSFAGCWLTRKDKQVRNYLGMGLIPQAGVAIGLAALGARTLGGEMGDALETVILTSSVLYELIGPGGTQLALYLSGSYSTKLEDLTPQVTPSPRKSEVDLLVERIQAIQKELPAHTGRMSEEEQAFLEAAEEQYYQMERSHLMHRRK